MFSPMPDMMQRYGVDDEVIKEGWFEWDDEGEDGRSGRLSLKRNETQPVAARRNGVYVSTVR